MKSLAPSLAAAALVAAALVPPPKAPPTTADDPFWQLHGAAPSARDAAAVAEVRLAVRRDPAESFAIAGR
jgi:hypothetical protein